MPSNRIWLSVLTFLIILLASVITILYARGYQLSPRSGDIIKTGILVVGSQPDGAVVYIDGRLTSATNATLSYLIPKTYHVRITKEGYLPWEKTVQVKQELVTKIEALLWPTSPELKPLTFTGARNPVLSPDTSKLVYVLPFGTKAGVWVMNISERPFLLSREPRQLAVDTPASPLSSATFTWSPDSRYVLTRTGTSEETTRTYLLDTERASQPLFDVTPTIHATIASWKQEVQIREEARIGRLEPIHQEAFVRFSLIEHASPSATSPRWQLSKNATPASDLPRLPFIPVAPYRYMWSPGETRVLVTDSNGGNPRVYDLKTKQTNTIPEALTYSWYPEQPDSRHIVLVKEKSISIVEFDGSNETQVYTGQFDNSYVFPWPTGGRLIILTSYNAGAGELSNLYSVNLR